MLTSEELRGAGVSGPVRNGWLLSVAAAASLMWSAVPAQAQPYPNFADVPVVFTHSPSVFSQVLADAQTRPVRMVILGDSQETSPGGFGSIYIPRLNFEMYERFGNSPETPFSAGSSNTGGGAPWAEWLIRQAAAAPGPAPSRVPFSSLPPNITGGACTSLGGVNINNNEAYGSLVMLQPRADDTSPGAGVAGQTNYFDTSQGVYVDVYAAANASSGEVRCRVTPHTTHAPSYFQPTTAVVDTSLHLDQPGSYFRHQRLGPFGLNGRPYFQVELSGTRADALTDIVAVDFASAANPTGVVVSTLSMGGFKSDDYLASHAGGTALLALYNPDVVWITYGANDAANNYSTTTFRNNILALITQLRTVVRSDLPIIIIADPYAHLTDAQVALLDQYPGVAYSIAQSDPLVCALNSRRLTNDAGWNAANFSTFLADQVHYNATGASLKAQLEVQALWDAFGPPACDADLNQDGVADQTDIDYLINVVAGGPNPAGADADFNHDGVADQGDVDALINVIAGGACP